MTGDSPLISIGLTCYNRPDMLPQALESLTSQTYKNIEIIIGDNTEGNECGCVVESFNDPRIRYYHHPKDIGGEENARFVRSKCTGEYFMWASDDDVWAPRFIEELYTVIRDGRYLVVMCRALWLDSGGIIPAKSIPADFNSWTRFHQFFYYITSHPWRQMKFMSICGLQDKSIIDLHLPDGLWNVGGDNLWSLEVLARGKIAFTDGMLMIKNQVWRKDGPLDRRAFDPYDLSLSFNIVQIYRRFRNGPDDWVRKFTLHYYNEVGRVIDDSGFDRYQKAVLKIANVFCRLRILSIY